MKNWKKCLVSEASSIISAIRVIDLTEAKIAVIVDDDNHLKGTVTDYDVRKAILAGGDLHKNVQTIMNITPKKLGVGADENTILSEMLGKAVRQLPLVDMDGRVVDIKILSDFNDNASEKDNPVLLMAGGLGTRLRPLTNSCPKPLLKIGNKPILEIIVENFIQEGFRNFFISVNYKAEMIEDYFGDGSKWGVSIQYLHENKRLGTAGAMSLLPKGITKPIIVMNGDLLTKVNFYQLLEFHTKHHGAATMCVREYTYQIPFGVVRFDDWKITELVEKPKTTEFVNAGIYVVSPEVFYGLKENEYIDMPDIFQQLIERKKSTSLIFPIREYWLDVGRLEDFERARAEINELI